ncbi:eukaryotic aspartyl protease [Ancylostoma duodenale]|uniref:Eukaryotic aspartyl protease n=1 Tax=Ancylostoma duodenale TaxID=51022 RepID=A0A0C2D4T4_9BILA|nr:eukaryotic aspartyl protease [Ancylostoma duodenale]
MKTVLLLVSLLVVLYAKKITMQTRRTGSLRAKLIATKQLQHYVEKQRAKRVGILKRGSEPFRDFYDDFYIGEAISDTGTSWIGAPQQVIDNVVDATGADYDFFQDIYTVPCNNMDTLPPFNVTINGKEYSIPSSEYVLDLGLGNGTCALTFFAMDDSNGSDPTWILGDTFIRTFCNIYDVGGKQIGFAKAKHGKI